MSNVHTITLPDSTTATRKSATRTYTCAVMVTEYRSQADLDAQIARFAALAASCADRLENGTPGYSPKGLARDMARYQGEVARLQALTPGNVYWVRSWHARVDLAKVTGPTDTVVVLDANLQADLTPAPVEAPKAPRSSWATRLQAVLTGEEVITLSAATMATLGWPASAAKHRAYWGANPAGKAARAAGYTPSLRKVDGALALVLTRQG